MRRAVSDTRARVARSLRSLVEFPNIGPALAGRWDRYGFINRRDRSRHVTGLTRVLEVLG
jgi:hypothetical protein